MVWRFIFARNLSAVGKLVEEIIMSSIAEIAQNSQFDVDGNKIKVSCHNVHVYYGNGAAHAIKGVDMEIREKAVTAFIGPSGCGKSTFLRCINRMNDTIDGCEVKGHIALDDEDIYDKKTSTLCSLDGVLAWYSKSLTHFPNLFLKMLHMAHGFMVWLRVEKNWVISWSPL